MNSPLSFLVAGKALQTVKILEESHHCDRPLQALRGPAKLLQENAWCEEMKERTGWGQSQVMGPVEDGHRRDLIPNIF